LNRLERLATSPIRVARLCEASLLRFSTGGLLPHREHRAIASGGKTPAPGEISSLGRYDPAQVSELLQQLDDYRRSVDRFRWDVPESFNFGRDVVDRLAADPNRPALLWRSASGGERRLTFADVARESNRFAQLLRSLDVQPGQPVIIMLPRIPEWHIALVGTLKAGALAIPSSTILRPKDIAYRARHSEAVAIVSIDEQTGAVDAVRDEMPSVKHYIVCTRDGAEARAGERGGGGGNRRDPHWVDLREALESVPEGTSAAQPTRASDPALVYYTSGTTGPPKAVLHNHGYTSAQRHTALLWHGVREGDRLWTTSDTGWAKAAYGVIFGPWCAGAEVFLYDGRFEAARELELLAEVAPQIFCAPPTEFRLLVKEDLSRLRLPALRECVSAGEPLNPEVIRTWRDATGLTIRDGYGQTETILLVGNFPNTPVRPGSMGLPMPGHRVAVIDQTGNALPPGEVGDIALRGTPPSLFVEYWKDEEASRACRRGEWYVTGDRAYRDEDGYFWFVARADDLIISAGYRIGPFEVESALIEHPDVVEAAAVAAPDVDRGSVVKAYVVVRDGVSAGPELATRLQEHVKKTTAPYKYPRIIEFVSELPKTVSGKIRRIELRQRAEAEAGGGG
jgi:acetyl-CoA synthetase/medium-chain acyl-CoA synthetase